MADEKESTKQKILHAAHKLFADHGFDGASIREIATAADVNVASINYYFNSKENLFLQSLVLCYEKTQHLIEEAVQKQEVRTTQDLAIKIFRYYIDPVHEMQKSFKMFVLDAKELPPELVAQTERFGPPGGAHLRLFLQKQLGDKNISEKRMRWAVTAIFSHITHMALIHMSCVGKVMEKNLPQFWAVEPIEEGILDLVNMVIQRISQEQS